jgi:hypothetical protein
MCSAQDWKFAAKQFLKKYPRDVVVHREFFFSFFRFFVGSSIGFDYGN